MKNPKLQARIAGALYMFVIAASVFALSMTSQLIVSGDASATARNLVQSEHLFRMAFTANILANAAYIGVTALLYALLKPVNPVLSLLAALFSMAGAAIAGSNMVHQLHALSYLGDAAYLAAFTPEQAQALSRLSLREAGIGNSVSLMFYGFYCSCLAVLVFGARFLPRLLSVLLLIAGIGWLTGSLTTFLAPQLASSVTGITTAAAGLGEGLFTLWLLVMGVNAAKWREQAGAP